MRWEAWVLVIYQSLNVLIALYYLGSGRLYHPTRAALAVSLVASAAQVWLVLRLAGAS